MESNLRNRLAACERANRRTRLLLLVSVAGLTVLAGFSQRVPQQPQVTDTLRVAELVIVDDEGVKRVRHADWTVTEAGFGFDLGAEKFVGS